MEDVVGAGGVGLQPRIDAETANARTKTDEPSEVRGRNVVESIFAIIVGEPSFATSVLIAVFELELSFVRPSSGLESR